MKYLILAMTIGYAFIGQQAHAQDLKKDVCTQAYALEYYVTAKHKGGLIELQSPIFGHALVKTTAKYFKEGPLNMRIKYKEMKEMPMENGFTAQVRVWEECK